MRRIARGTSHQPEFHYCVVRTDLPPGVAAAQLVHAAGESSDRVSVGTHAVVLGVGSESHLLDVADKLRDAGLPVHVVYEPDFPYDGQAMALALPPGPRCAVLRGLALYRGCVPLQENR